jgi:hypothetical protein
MATFQPNGSLSLSCVYLVQALVRIPLTHSRSSYSETLDSASFYSKYFVSRSLLASDNRPLWRCGNYWMGWTNMVEYKRASSTSISYAVCIFGIFFLVYGSGINPAY